MLKVIAAIGLVAREGGGEEVDDGEGMLDGRAAPLIVVAVVADAKVLAVGTGEVIIAVGHGLDVLVEDPLTAHRQKDQLAPQRRAMAVGTVGRALMADTAAEGKAVKGHKIGKDAARTEVVDIGALVIDRDGKAEHIAHQLCLVRMAVDVPLLRGGIAHLHPCCKKLLAPRDEVGLLFLGEVLVEPIVHQGGNENEVPRKAADHQVDAPVRLEVIEDLQGNIDQPTRLDGILGEPGLVRLGLDHKRDHQVVLPCLDVIVKEREILAAHLKEQLVGTLVLGVRKVCHQPFSVLFTEHKARMLVGRYQLRLLVGGSQHTFLLGPKCGRDLPLHYTRFAVG